MFFVKPGLPTCDFSAARRLLEGIIKLQSCFVSAFWGTPVIIQLESCRIIIRVATIYQVSARYQVLLLHKFNLDLLRRLLTSHYHQGGHSGWRDSRQQHSFMWAVLPLFVGHVFIHACVLSLNISLYSHKTHNENGNDELGLPQRSNRGIGSMFYVIVHLIVFSSLLSSRTQKLTSFSSLCKYGSFQIP